MATITPDLDGSRFNVMHTKLLTTNIIAVLSNSRADQPLKN